MHSTHAQQSYLSVVWRSLTPPSKIGKPTLKIGKGPSRFLRVGSGYIRQTNLSVSREPGDKVIQYLSLEQKIGDKIQAQTNKQTGQNVSQGKIEMSELV